MEGRLHICVAVGQQELKVSSESILNVTSITLNNISQKYKNWRLLFLGNTFSLQLVHVLLFIFPNVPSLTYTEIVNILLCFRMHYFKYPITDVKSRQDTVLSIPVSLSYLL